MSDTLIQKAIQRGLAFLASTQLSQGSWEIQYAATPDFKENLKHIVEVFTVAYILREIAPAREFYDSQAMIESACDFLGAQRRSDRLWKYYKRGDMRLLPNDFDTTSTVAAALYLAGRPLDGGEILAIMDEYRHPEGGYWTYAMPPVAPEKNWFYPIDRNFYPEYIINAHILYFMALYQLPHQAQLAFLQRVFQSKAYQKPQVFYDSALLFLYNLAKGAAGLADSAVHCIEMQAHVAAVLSGQDASILDNALATGVLAYCIDNFESQAEPIQRLIESQEADGGWPRVHYYITPISYHGCREVVTAIMINVLATYLERKN